MGPVLFLIFINDIDIGIHNAMLKFADDTKLFGTVQTEDQHTCLQTDLAILEEWASNWQMQFNVSKCKVLHVGRKNRKLEYSMGNRLLESVKEEKDLGVLISDNLKSSRQCQAAYSKANQMLGMIRRTISYKSKGIMVPLYKSIVRPLVEYCTPAWFGQVVL